MPDPEQPIPESSPEPVAPEPVAPPDPEPVAPEPVQASVESRLAALEAAVGRIDGNFAPARLV